MAAPVSFPWGQVLTFSAMVGLLDFNFSINGAWMDWWEEWLRHLFRFLVIGWVAAIAWLLTSPLGARLGCFNVLVPTVVLAAIPSLPLLLNPSFLLFEVGMWPFYVLLWTLFLTCGVLVGLASRPGRSLIAMCARVVLAALLFTQPILSVFATNAVRDQDFSEAIRAGMRQALAEADPRLDLAKLTDFAWDSVTLYPTWDERRPVNCLPSGSLDALPKVEQHLIETSIRSRGGRTIIFLSDGRIVRWLRADDDLFLAIPFQDSLETWDAERFLRSCGIPRQASTFAIIPGKDTGNRAVLDIALPGVP